MSHGWDIKERSFNKTTPKAYIDDISNTAVKENINDLGVQARWRQQANAVYSSWGYWEQVTEPLKNSFKENSKSKSKVSSNKKPQHHDMSMLNNQS